VDVTSGKGQTMPFESGSGEAGDYRHEVGGPLLRGSFPTEVVEALRDMVRAVVEEEGWDAPFTVFGLRWVVEPAPLLESLEEAGTPALAAVEVTPLLQGSHPVEALPGQVLPEEFDAAILTTEGWDYPDRLRGRSTEYLASLGAPSGLPDRVEVRVISYLSRTGDESMLLLRYQDRTTPPEEILSDEGTAGRVQDAFRRYVGLPVAPGDEKVTHLLGRLWLATLLEDVDRAGEAFPAEGRMDRGDPLEVLAGPFAELLAVLDEDDRTGSADRTPRVVDRRALLLEFLDALTWEQAHTLASNDSFPVEIPRELVRWCDAPLFAKLVMESIPTQGQLLDAIVLAGAPTLAGQVLDELAVRGWLERSFPPTRLPLPSRPPRNGPCPCGSGRKFKSCHGRPLGHPL